MFLSCSHSLALKSAVCSLCLCERVYAAWISIIMVFCCVSPLSMGLFYSVNFSVLQQGPASKTCWRLALWVGGSCMQSTLWVAGFPPSPPVKTSVALLFCSLHFSFLLRFFTQFLRWGKNLRCGLFVLVWCRFSHVLGRFSYLHDSSLNCKGLSWYHVHSSACLAVHTNAIVTHWLPAHRMYIQGESLWAIWDVIVDTEAVRCSTASAFSCHMALAAASTGLSIFLFTVTSCLCLSCLSLPSVKITMLTSLEGAYWARVQLVIWEKWIRGFKMRWVLEIKEEVKWKAEWELSCLHLTFFFFFGTNPKFQPLEDSDLFLTCVHH